MVICLKNILFIEIEIKNTNNFQFFDPLTRFYPHSKKVKRNFSKLKYSPLTLFENKIYKTEFQ